ncbi:major surface protein MSP1 subunit alpha [Anaplasma marginale]|uniref:major surface protein MSP1 subunit alpha n=1 Tax=Anaplasma marginale TaxID=770 RepID=UPI000568752D|nr:hypothetical protein [Anaplasma marginale]
MLCGNLAFIFTVCVCCVKGKDRPGGGSGNVWAAGKTVRFSDKVHNISPVRVRVGDPAMGTVIGAKRKIRERSMVSFFGAGQFIITIAALVAAIFAICACLRTTLAGPSGTLIWGCLALVVLLPLLGTVAYMAVQDEREDGVVADYARVVREGSVWEHQRQLLEDRSTFSGMRALAAMAVFEFICAIVACACMAAKPGTWQGSALFLATLALFMASAVVVVGTRRHSSVLVLSDAPVVGLSPDVRPAAPSGGQQAPVTAVPADACRSSADAPGTSVSSVVLDSTAASGAGVSGQQAALHLARENGASVGICA